MKTDPHQLLTLRAPEEPDTSRSRSGLENDCYTLKLLTLLAPAYNYPMRTKLSGVLNRVMDDEVRVQIGPFEYQVLVSESTRRQLQLRLGQELILHLSEYLEGGPNANRFIPRLIGFPTEAELEFFDLFCTVDKIGVKKALRAMSRGVREIAEAINRQDAKWLTTLPGIGAATAEQIVATLKRKVTSYAFLPGEVVEAPTPGTEGTKKPSAKRTTANAAPVNDTMPSVQLLDDIYQAMIGLGLQPLDARDKLDTLLQSGQAFANAQDALSIIFTRRT